MGGEQLLTEGLVGPPPNQLPYLTETLY